MIELTLGPARVVWTDRHGPDRIGGVSAAPYDTTNLALHVGDVSALVEENRVRVANHLGLCDPARWWWLRQVHGSAVVTASGQVPPPVPEADAAVTAMADVPLVVLTADCAPIALACDNAIAVVHAGWAGLLAGVVAAAVGRLRAVGSGEVHAALGPCVHPDRYEFGPTDLATLVERFGPTIASRTADGAPAFALPHAVRQALLEVGVKGLVDVGICTAGSPDHFSHRRDGRTGRQALIMVLTG